MIASTLSRRAGLARTALSLALAGVLLTGCTRRGEPEEILDLTEALPLAELSSETSLVDFGTTAGGSHLVAGWSWKEKSADGTTFVWSNGGESIVEFFLARPRDVEISLRVQSFPFEDGDRQHLTAEIGGITMASFELGGGWQEVAFPLPASSLRGGTNRLRFRFSRVADAGRGRSARRLAVAFDWMRLGVAQAGNGREQPAASVVDGALTMVGNTRLDYFLQLPAGAFLEVGAVAVEGGAALTIEVEEDLGDWRRIAMLEHGAETTRWPLVGSSGIVRLRLTVRGDGQGVGAGSVRLLRPRVLGWADEGGPDRQTTAAGHGPEDTAGDERRPDVVLYVVDTLRADHLGAYGHPREISPAIDAFAAEAVTFEKAVAQAPWTLPSMASIFTGLTPRTHGTTTKESRLPDDVETIASALQGAGYATGGVVSNGFVSRAFGFGRGFDNFELISDLGTRAEEVLAAGSRWLDSVAEESPAFLYVHSIDPHDSYDPPGRFRPSGTSSEGAVEVGSRDAMKRLKDARTEPSPDLVESLLDLYGGEVAYSDWAFGHFMEDLRERGRYDSALVIFVSDHGEEFFDHGGWLHGHSLHAEVIDIPLIVKFPGGRFAGRRVGTPVRQIDLFPTLIDYLDLPAVEDLEGKSLLPLISGLEQASGLEAPGPALSYLENRAVSVVVDRWKLIARPVGSTLRRRQLYDLARDPGETVDLAAERPVLVGYLSSVITESFLAGRRQVERQSSVLDAEMRRHLEALGYVD